MSDDIKKHDHKSVTTVGQVEDAGKAGEAAVLEHTFGWVDFV